MTSSTPSTWRIGHERVLDISSTLVMGILNVTPDSFHDGGRYLDPASALEQARLLVTEGADLVDVGGESTRPGASRIDDAEQIRRTVEVIRAIRSECPIAISIDTTRAAVADAALDAGADMINDVSAGTEDPEIFALAAQRGCGIVLMHRAGPPDADSWSDQYAQEPDYGSAGVVDSVRHALRERVEAAMSAGIDTAAIGVDPGFGFGKSVRQNLALLEGLSEVVSDGFPVLVGASRKSFIGAVGGEECSENRLIGSLAAAVLAANKGAAMIRAHDVQETVEALGVAVAARESARTVWSG